MSKLLGLQEFAEKWGGPDGQLRGGLSALTNWRRRFDDFPDPIQPGGRPQLYDEDHLLIWARRHNKIADTADSGAQSGPIAVMSRQVTETDVEGDDSPTRRITYALGLTAARFEQLQLDPGTQGSDLGPQADAFRSRLSTIDADHLAEIDELMKHPRHSGSLLQSELRSGRPDVGLAIRSEFAELASDDIYFDTPLAALTLLSAIDIRGVIHDPCCGSGMMLSLAQRREPSVTVTGQDFDPFLAASTALLFSAEGINAEITTGDSLLRSEDARRYDTVVANPPLNHPEARSTRRVRFERLSAWTDQWVTTCAEMLAPGGMAGVVVPTKWLTASGGLAATTRKQLISDGQLVAAIRVPMPTRTRRVNTAVVLILRAERSPAHDGVLVLDIALNAPPPTWGDMTPELEKVAHDAGAVVRQWQATAKVDSFDSNVGNPRVVSVDNALEGLFFETGTETSFGAVATPTGAKTSTAAPATSAALDSPFQDASRLATALETQLDALRDQIHKLTEAERLGRETADDDAATLSAYVNNGSILVLTGREWKQRLPESVVNVITLVTSGSEFGNVSFSSVADAPTQSRGIAMLASVDHDVPLEFLAAWLQSSSTQRLLHALGTGGTTALMSVSRTDVLRLPTEFPPVATRRAISSAWQQADEIARLATQTQRSLVDLFR